MKIFGFLLIALFWLGGCLGMQAGEDPYAILGVDKDATQATIRKAYLTHSKKFHPDKNVGSEDQAAKKFSQLTTAYNVLSDPDKKQAYDNGTFLYQKITAQELAAIWEQFYKETESSQQEINKLKNELLNQNIENFAAQQDGERKIFVFKFQGEIDLLNQKDNSSLKCNKLI